jgi:archaetidylinositol phosphate synthase
MIGSLLVSYSRSKAESIGIKMESIGIAERAERLIIILITSLIAFIWQPRIIMNIGIIILAIITNFTVLQRVIYVYYKTKNRI